MTNSPFSLRRKFIINLGKALHKFGTPAYRLEQHLLNVSASLNMGGSFMTNPTSLTFALWELGEHEQQQIFVMRVKPGELDLGSLARTDELVDELENGERSLIEAIERLEDINNRPPPYSKLTSLCAFGISGAAFTMLMGTNWYDVFWSLIMSLVVYPFVLWAERSKRIADMLEPLGSLVSAFIVAGLVHLDPHINAPLVVLSSIIAFIPGLALTLGLRELATRDLMSGTARIMDAAMMLFKLYFGAVLGFSIGGFVWGEGNFIPSNPVAGWTAWLAVFLLGASLVVMFKIRLKDSPWGILAGFISFGTSAITAFYFDAVLGAFFGAFFVSIYSSLYSRIFNAPASLVLLQGLVVLVPGSKLYMGLSTVVTGQEVLLGEHIGAQPFLILMSLVAGLIFSNVALKPSRTL